MAKAILDPDQVTVLAGPSEADKHWQDVMFPLTRPLTPNEQELMRIMLAAALDTFFKTVIK